MEYEMLSNPVQGYNGQVCVGGDGSGILVSFLYMLLEWELGADGVGIGLGPSHTSTAVPDGAGRVHMYHPGKPRPQCRGT